MSVFQFVVKVESSLPREETRKLLNDLINIGLGDAEQTVADGQDGDHRAQLALDLVIEEPK